MKHFTCVHDVRDINNLLQEAISLKNAPLQHHSLGTGKTLGLIFMNPSLRTRLSTQKAAMNLGMQVMVMNLNEEGWALETEEGVIMDGNRVEHIREAAGVLGEYCDIIGIRSFPKLKDREEDYSEVFLAQLKRYSSAPILSLESATRHPLQSLADLLTITEISQKHNLKRPKVALTWAPHIKPLPQAVANSFSEWMCRADVDFVISHPEGLALKEEFTANATITYNQEDALDGADFVYVKNWSSYEDYGRVPEGCNDWMLTPEKLASTNNARVMHCLPVRRGLELSHEVLDGPHAAVTQQAANRVPAAQAVLKQMLQVI